GFPTRCGETLVILASLQGSTTRSTQRRRQPYIQGCRLNTSNGVPGAVVPIATMPVMAIVDLVPGVVPIVLVMVPPVVGVEGQTHVREVHAGIGMPAIAET